MTKLNNRIPVALYVKTQFHNKILMKPSSLCVQTLRRLVMQPVILLQREYWRVQLCTSSTGQELGNVSYWFPACLRWAHRVEVIWKPFLLVLSPSSHFNLSAQPRAASSQPPLPGEAGVQWPRSVHARPSMARKLIPAPLPLARKNSTGLETNIHILYIIHGSHPGYHIKWGSITQPAHGEEPVCPVQECGKRKK